MVRASHLRRQGELTRDAGEWRDRFGSALSLLIYCGIKRYGASALRLVEGSPRQIDIDGCRRWLGAIAMRETGGQHDGNTTPFSYRDRAVAA